MDIKAILKRAKGRAIATQKIASGLGEEASYIYIEGIRQGDRLLRDTKTHCRRVALLTVLIAVVQLELFLPRLTPIFDYATMPLSIQLLVSLSSIANRWLLILGIIVLADILVWLYRPEVWEHFLLEAPYVRKIMLPLYFYRYYCTKSFGAEDRQALLATGNDAFSLEEGSLTESNTKDAYPVLASAICAEREQKIISKEEYIKMARYTHSLLEESSFDFKEIFSYSCMGFLIVLTAFILMTICSTL